METAINIGYAYCKLFDLITLSAFSILNLKLLKTAPLNEFEFDDCFFFYGADLHVVCFDRA
jgi:hypothetical protein